MPEKADLVVEGKNLSVSNLEKVLYPKVGFTKGQVIDYYIKIAPVLLPHLKDRPLTMKRYPNGVDKEFFYEKNCPAHRPKWVKTAKVWSEGNNKTMNYCLAQDLPTLVWAANLADLELHTSLAKKKDVARPTMMVFDLDPGAPADIVHCCQVGLWLRDLLGQIKLKSFAKTSGSKGLQVYVPLNTTVTFDQTKDLSRALAQLLERAHGNLVTSNMSKSVRKGKVFVDWSQNDEHKTTICVYSLRAKEEPTVSTPVTWDEVANCLKKKKADLLRFRSDKTLERMKKLGDLFAPVEKLKQKPPEEMEVRRLVNSSIRFAAAALMLLCSNWTLAAADDFPLKRMKSFTWVVDYEPFWSPDGRQIVLISSRHGGMKVHVVDANSASNGSDMRQLTTGDAEDDTPSWSPDGKMIAFVSIRDGVSQIFVMSADGTNVRQLTKGNAENIHPTWSPDSARILFNTTHFSGATAADGTNVPSDNKVIGEQIDKKMDLATIRPDGTDLKRITTGGGFTYASYSPDGMSILHRRVDGALSHLFIMNADGSNDHDISGKRNIDGWPAWSSDGKRVIFSRRVKGAFQLFVMSRDGSNARQLTDAAGEFVNPRWSPDGTKVLCSRRLGDMNLVIFPAPK